QPWTLIGPQGTPVLANGDASITVADPTAGLIKITVHHSKTAQLATSRYHDALQVSVGLPTRGASWRHDRELRRPRARGAARHVVPILRTISPTRTPANSISCNPVRAGEGPNALRSIKPARLPHAARRRSGSSVMAGRGAGAADRDAAGWMARPRN